MLICVVVMSDPVETLFERAAHFGVSMAALCVRAGVAQSTPSRWRGGRNSATYGTLRKLNHALDALIGEKGGGHVAENTGLAPEPSPGKTDDLAAPAGRMAEGGPARPASAQCEEAA